jgi:YggT family protein
MVPSRKIIPPLGGVDITPIVWVGIVSLLREILLGQQGLLRMMF